MLANGSQSYVQQAQAPQSPSAPSAPQVQDNGKSTFQQVVNGVQTAAQIAAMFL